MFFDTIVILVRETGLALKVELTPVMSILNNFIERSFNCSQTKLVAIILVLSVFAIFRLNDFSSNQFDFSSLKREKQVAPNGH